MKKISHSTDALLFIRFLLVLITPSSFLLAQEAQPLQTLSPKAPPLETPFVTPPPTSLPIPGLPTEAPLVPMAPQPAASPSAAPLSQNQPTDLGTDGSTRVPVKAFVVATTAFVTREADPKSAVVVQLKEGDELELLEARETYAKVRYKLEGEFPVTGWIPLAVISKPMANAPRLGNTGAQNYIPSEKAPVVTEVKEFPQAEMKEKIILPESGQKFVLDTPKSAAMVAPVPPPISHRKTSGWSNELTTQMGLQSWEETVTTKQASGAYYPASFLNYDLHGISITFNDELSYKYPNQNLTLGVNGLYRFSYFTDSVAETNDEVAKSSIQAQFHELEISPFARMQFPIRSGWRIEPQLGLDIGYHSFITNQLRDISPSNPNRSGQAILFSVNAYYFRLHLKPTVQMPYDLKLSPQVSMLLFYLFTETPSGDFPVGAADAGKIRTGSPDGGSFGLSYGGELAWNMTRVAYPNSDLVLTVLFQDFSRKYTGAGNRAGTQTLDAKASVTTSVYSLGYRYLF